MELPLRRHDGAFRWFLTRVNPLRGSDGSILRWIGINTDIHERKEAEAEKAHLLGKAQEANRAKDEFLAMLGHELRNPLAPILTAVQLMKLRENAPSREREVIERQAQHLVRLVDDLLDVSRVVRGRIVLRRKPLQLREVVVKGVEIASPALEKARHHLEVAVPEDLWLDADDVRIAQVVANLVTNAAKYTPPGGHVRIAARRDGAQVELTVEDDGLGIEPELLPRVFELFVQGARGIDRSEGGLGLGLALVRTLTELHGGSVVARSEGRGRGTQLVLRLPALDDPPRVLAMGVPPAAADLPRVLAMGVPPAAAAPPSSAPAPAFAPAARRRRVLVVDDNSDATESLASLLREAGHEVATALDAASAETTARSFAPEIALLDLGLPVVDGIELGRRLRAHDASLRLVAVTGYGAEPDKRRTEAAGFGAHLVKPVSVDALLDSLEG
jgi:signal transduction histidine kinase